jgi:hypothetical protein
LNSIPFNDQETLPLIQGQLIGLDIIGPAFKPWDNRYVVDLLAVMNFPNGFYDDIAALKCSEESGFLV